MKGKLLPFRRVEGIVTDLSDEALVAACAVGESAALGALFDRYHAHVRRFLARMSGTDDRDLDDLVQSTFLEVQRSAAGFGGRAAVRSWILGIAANVVRHHVRTEIRRRTLTAGLLDEPARDSTSPDAALHDRQLIDLVLEAQQQLPHDLRVVFVMCDLEDVPDGEAAGLLGIRPGTLWRRLHEARKALRAALERKEAR